MKEASGEYMVLELPRSVSHVYWLKIVSLRSVLY